ncbi:MAG: PBP1A family penicillin-binding protein [Acidimicrobiia bacterium]|nr:PBP1A family penicillin-binding protein [Acidimicrobiia bacterium]MBV9042368.1 PBP1A family penicillin-binding protein [Acidimicrobiia bacterium]
MLFLFGLLGATAIGGIAYVIAQVPLPKDAPLAQTTILTDAKGNQLAVLHGDENRLPVKLNQVPKVLQDAVISSEDRKFYSHSGVDPAGVLRATWADIRHGGAVQGGSSITQQYVKNTYTGSQRTFMRKVKEAVLAMKVERKYSKRQILERYLNTIYFGRGAYGVQAAAHAYFDKDVQQLGLPESALLAGLIRGPEEADPARGPAPAALAAQRRSEVLQAMVETHAITATQKVEAESVPIESKPHAAKTTIASSAPGSEYFVDYVRRQLVKSYGEDAVLRGGLHVQTTLDQGLQKQAYDAVYKTLWDSKNDPAGALVTMDDDGHVLAMVGGRDWNASKVNLAVGTGGGGVGRQAGSSFKPVVLAEMLKEGYSVESSFLGPQKITLPKADNGKDWEVSNFDNESFGRLNLVDATAHSVNTVYAQLVTAIGPQNVIPTAQALGIRSSLDPVPSITLGTQNVSVMEMADAYLSFANEGMQTDPQAFSKVTDASGTVLYDGKPHRTKALSRTQADVMNFTLSQVVQRGTGTGAQIGVPVAGKTGTTEDFGDAWFVGYTPKLTTAVWMGYPEGQSKKMTDVHGVHNVNGGSLPATIFNRFMTRAVHDPRFANAGDFPKPSSFPGKILGQRVPYVDQSATTPTSVGTATTAHPKTTAPSALTPPTTSAGPKPTAPPPTSPPQTMPPAAPPPEPPPTRTPPTRPPPRP